MASSKLPPTCTDLTTWLRANFGRRALAALTGSDWRALTAAAHLLALRAYDRELPLSGFRDVVLCIQPKAREFAYHAIAHFGDWDDRDAVWAEAGLPPLDRVSGPIPND